VRALDPGLDLLSIRAVEAQRGLDQPRVDLEIRPSIRGGSAVVLGHLYDFPDIEAGTDHGRPAAQSAIDEVDVRCSSMITPSSR
jgi:hypothetical protein